MQRPTSNNRCSVWRTNLTKTLPWPRHCRPKPRMTFWRFWLSSCTWLVSVVAERGHCRRIRAISCRLFLCLVQCRGIGDALTTLLRRKGIDQQMRWADEPFLCVDHGIPRKGLGPLANGTGLQYELGGLEVGAASHDPVLQVTQDTHGWLSFYHGRARASR